jgi:alpha-methylacyl-CoA racemase
MRGAYPTKGAGVLAHIRVVVLGGIGPAPFAAMLLADMGADVILVDRPGTPWRDREIPLDAVLRRGQRSLAADLKSADDLDTIRQLIASSDILIEGFRPGVAERLGLGPDDCHQLNEGLIYGRVTGWGQDGPYAQRPGHDLDYIAAAGIVGALGSPDQEPPPPLCLLGDFAGGGMFLVIGLLGALVERMSSGNGQVVDAAMMDGAALMMSPIYAQRSAGAWVDRRQANHMDGGAPFYRCYRTQDGQYLAVGSVEQQFYENLLGVLGLTDVPLAGQWDRAQWPVTSDRFAQVFSTRTRQEWVEAFEGVDACVEPVRGLGESLVHPQALARGTFTEVDGLVHVSPAPRFSRSGVRAPSAWARPGEHSAELRAELSTRAGRLENRRRAPLLPPPMKPHEP